MLTLTNGKEILFSRDGAHSVGGLMVGGLISPNASHAPVTLPEKRQGETQCNEECAKTIAC
jgi:hypothetical protein